MAYYLSPETAGLSPEQRKNEEIAQRARFGVTEPAPVATPEPTVSQTYQNFSAPETDRAYDTALDEMGSYYQKQAQQPISNEQIYRDTLSQYQSQIDATNRIYQDQLRRAQVEGMGRLGSQRAIAARSGTLGSDFGAAQESQVQGFNRDIESDIMNAQNAKIAQIMGLARSQSAEEVAARRTAKQQGAESYLQYLAGKTERRRTGISSLASAMLSQGITPDEIDPARLKEIATQYGASEDDIRAAFFEVQKTAQSQAAADDLKTRKTEAEIAKINADIASGKYITIGEGTMLRNLETGETIKNPKTYAPSSGGAGVIGDNPQLYSGLTPGTATAVRSLVGKFSSEPVVQNFATVQEGHNFAQSIQNNTNNPADDQALIYSLAKALDPGSVVREGEYATAQKYAQSWVNAYGKGIEQALLGTGFLSEDARSNIKKVIEQKYKASQNSYTNLQKNYEGRVNNLTGRGDGSRFLIDYNAPLDGTSQENMPVSSDGLSDDEAYQLYLSTSNGAN
jgi:hypothetical protein